MKSEVKSHDGSPSVRAGKSSPQNPPTTPQVDATTPSPSACHWWGVEIVWFSVWKIHLPITKSFFFAVISKIPQVDGNAMRFSDGKKWIMLFGSVLNLKHYLYSRVVILPTEVLGREKSSPLRTCTFPFFWWVAEWWLALKRGLWNALKGCQYCAWSKCLWAQWPCAHWGSTWQVAAMMKGWLPEMDPGVSPEWLRCYEALIACIAPGF